MPTTYFDYETAAKGADLSPADLFRLEALVRAEFPNDDMLYELHVLRACMAIRDGVASLVEVLGAPPAQATAAR